MHELGTATNSLWIWNNQSSLQIRDFCQFVWQTLFVVFLDSFDSMLRRYTLQPNSFLCYHMQFFSLKRSTLRWIKWSKFCMVIKIYITWEVPGISGCGAYYSGDSELQLKWRNQTKLLLDYTHKCQPVARNCYVTAKTSSANCIEV